jgi:hypothetical protein
MKCDFRASFLACTFTSPCFGRKPKVRVVSLGITYGISRNISFCNWLRQLKVFLTTTLEIKIIANDIFNCLKQVAKCGFYTNMVAYTEVRK